VGWRAACVVLIAGLAACESPLRLEQVEAEKAKPIRRSDQFQVAVASGSTVVVVGNHGLILTSTDAATAATPTWSRQELAGWPSFIDLTACPDGTFAALAVEGQVWTSPDGRSWTANDFKTEESAQALTCDPDNRLWVVGSFSSILMSADGGKTWEDHSVGEDFILTSIQFFDAQTGIVLGEFGNILRTTDGGETWELGEPMPDEFYPQTALFTDPQTGWVASLGGKIMHTRDGGATWEPQQTGSLDPVYALARAGDTLYAVGGAGSMFRVEGDAWVPVRHGQPVRLLLRVLLPIGDKLLIGGAAGALYAVPMASLAAGGPAA
jgi:photosystem II stability/assembly factor-like uncharacterized protein